MATVNKAGALRSDFNNYDGTLAGSRTSSSGGTTTGLKVGNSVDVLQIFGAANTDNMNDGTILAATRGLGSQNVTLSFAPGTWTISNDLTIASNFTVHAPAGCIFSPASGKTLTIAGVLLREHATYTGGDGTVTVSGTDALASQDSKSNYAADTGEADAYAIAPSPAIASYAAGQRFRFLVGNTNTGASTLNVNSKGTKSIVKDVSTALSAGDLVANTIATVDYDGTNFILVSPENQNLGNLSLSGTLDVTGATTLSGATTVSGAFTSPGIDDNADTVFVTLDGNERLNIGHTTNLAGPGNVNPSIQTAGTTINQSSVGQGLFSDNSAGPSHNLFKSRSGTIGSFTIVQDGDTLGTYRFGADDGVDYQSIGAEITAVVNGTPGAGDLPTDLIIKTTADGAETTTERLRADTAGNISVGTAAIATTATDGFLYIPTCAGAATGTPTTKAGRSPIVFDTTNNRLYIWDPVGTTWHYIAVTA